MSTENIAKFAEAFATDPALQAKVHALHSGPEFAEGLAALATAEGTPFSAQEYRAAYPEGSAELSEEQLGNVAGGIRVARNPRSPFEQP